MGVATPVVLLLIFIAGTLLGPKQTTKVVLLPDRDGTVGSVEVATAAGKTLLYEAGQMTRVSGGDVPPEQATLVSIEALEKEYAAVLAAEPEPPVKFLLYFEQGSSELVPQSEKLLPEILAAIERRDSYAIGVYGHTDRTGSAAYNLKLSLQRALAVRQLLLDQGVKADYIDTSSHGEGNPLIPTADQVAEPRNRRVEVIVR